MSGGWKLRGYAVERLLGRGASSEVWRARVQATGEAVALKRLLHTDDQQPRRARAEAATLTALDHPNLVRLLDVVPTDDATVLVLDLADGGSLADLLTVRGRLTAGEVITAVAPVAAALAYVHRRGVVHGDVTPANILFTPGGVALLADLGVSRLTGDDSAAESTPAYLDPAVATGSVPGPASDVFMLGAVALHALTGAPLWPGADAASALTAARAGDLSELAGRLARAGVTEAMAGVLTRALVVDPQRRCTAADLALDLRHSGTPVAVELAAGRVRPEPGAFPVATAPREHGRTSPHPAAAGGYGPRHAAPVASDSSYGATSSRPLVRARLAPGSQPPTSAVARPRPVIPRRAAERPWWRPRPARRHALAASAVLVVLAGGAVAAVAGAVPGGGDRHGHAARSGPPVPARTSAGPSRWLTTLRALDEVRGRAFETRDPTLLRQVYVAGPLLSSDTALLTRLVPDGCRLTGAVTRYELVRVSTQARRIVVDARAAIAPSTLRCPGRPDRRAAAVGPATVRVELVRTAHGPRIAAQRIG